jgi:Tol biopolymer transport system component
VAIGLATALSALGLPDLLTGAPPAGAATENVTTPIASAAGRAKTSFSFRPWLSGDGRYVAFDSDSPNLITGDTNGKRDIFVYDRATSVTSRVSIGVSDAEADGDSQRPTVSGDGRYIAYWSEATNLVKDDNNDVADAFVYDRIDKVTERVSVRTDGTEATGESARPIISADGSTVAFESAADNLLAPDGVLKMQADKNEVRDVFVHDRESKETTRVSVAAGGEEAAGESLRPSISGDGSKVAFQSEAALAPEDTNQARDVYVYDREAGTATLVSRSSTGEPGGGGSFSPSLTPDGRYIAFWSNAGNLVPDDTNASSDVFVRDLVDGATQRISLNSDGLEGDGASSDPAISPDGRWVGFWSEATNLVTDDTNAVRDVFLHDRETGRTERVSVASDGSESDADSFSPNVASGGRVVAFDSEATTLSTGDQNKGSDVFVYLRDSSN